MVACLDYKSLTRFKFDWYYRYTYSSFLGPNLFLSSACLFCLIKSELFLSAVALTRVPLNSALVKLLLGNLFIYLQPSETNIRVSPKMIK